MIDFFKRQKEGEQLDFKQTVNHLPKIAKSLVAFANTKGGKLVIGLSDRAEVVGVDPEEEIFMLEQAAKKFCKPEIPLDFEIFEDEPEFEGAEPKQILVANIKESEKKPHFALDKNDIWTVYIRQNDQSIPASDALIKRMKKGIELLRGEVPDNLDFNSKKLLEYLEKNQRITLARFCKLVNISKRRATKLLVDLLNQGLLREHTHEKETYYTR